MNAKLKTALFVLCAVSVPASVSMARDPVSRGKAVTPASVQAESDSGLSPDGALDLDAVIAEIEAGNLALDDQPRTIEDFVAEADLVFRGTVVGIQYKLSEPTPPENIRIPHTFVTYAVSDLLHGEIAGETVTLRFMGGLDETTMLYSDSSIVPLFDLGDEDILFVKDNTAAESPLVGQTRGRLRLVDEQVFTNNGSAITLSQDGTLRPGARHALDQLETTTVIKGSFVVHRSARPDALPFSSASDPPEVIADGIRAASLFVAPVNRFGSRSRVHGPEGRIDGVGWPWKYALMVCRRYSNTERPC